MDCFKCTFTVHFCNNVHVSDCRIFAWNKRPIVPEHSPCAIDELQSVLYTVFFSRSHLKHPTFDFAHDFHSKYLWHIRIVPCHWMPFECEPPNKQIHPINQTYQLWVKQNKKRTQNNRMQERINWMESHSSSGFHKNIWTYDFIKIMETDEYCKLNDVH